MAKNRMIRPETWTDEKFVTLSPLARLLFIGMWNFACDNGHLDDSTLQLKMRVLPADDAPLDALLDEVIATGMVTRQDGYLKVANLAEKQFLDRRYLQFCDHCDQDKDLHYARTDRAARGPHAGSPSAARGLPMGAPRNGGGGGGGGGYSAQGRPAPRKGSRIPDDFAVTDAMRTWASEKAPGVDLDRATQRFVDYWTGESGAKASKLDWVAAWRTWIGKDHDRIGAVRPLRSPPAALPDPQQFAAADADWWGRES